MRERPGRPWLGDCYITDEHCGSRPGGCFQRAKAHCYIRSAIDTDGWSSTQRTTSCFVTAAECHRDHDGEGSWGPPPYQGDCYEMAPDEVVAE